MMKVQAPQVFRNLSILSFVFKWQSAKPFALKKETFRQFLQSSGILGHITRTLSDLYDTPKKPPYPLHYFRKHFYYVDPETPNLEFLLELLCEKFEELEILQKVNDLLKCELSKYDEEIHLEPFKFLPAKQYTVDKLYTKETFWDSSTTEIMSTESRVLMKRKDPYKVRLMDMGETEVKQKEATAGPEKGKYVDGKCDDKGGDELAMTSVVGHEEEDEQDEDIKGRLYYRVLGVYEDLEKEQREVQMIKK